MDSFIYLYLFIYYQAHRSDESPIRGEEEELMMKHFAGSAPFPNHLFLR